MIFVCKKCLTKAGKQSVWTHRVQKAERCGIRLWFGTCDVCGIKNECATVSEEMYSEVCRNLNPAEDDPDAMCGHPGHPDHYGDR
jgi:hypothetical protein